MDKLREAVKDWLLDHRDSKFSNNTQWLETKCPKCDANSKKRHLSIQLKDDKPMIVKCFRASCNMGGKLNRQMARALGMPAELSDQLEDE